MFKYAYDNSFFSFCKFSVNFRSVNFRDSLLTIYLTRFVGGTGAIIMIRNCLPVSFGFILPFFIYLVGIICAAYSAVIDTPTRSITWPNILTHWSSNIDTIIHCGGTDLKPMSGMCGGPGLNAAAYGAAHPVSHP